jgi:hypothetical protein
MTEVINNCLVNKQYILIEADTSGVILDLPPLHIVKQVCVVVRRIKSNNILFEKDLLIFVKLNGFSSGCDMFLWSEGKYVETSEDDFKEVVSTLNVNSLPYISVDMYDKGQSSKINKPRDIIKCWRVVLGFNAYKGYDIKNGFTVKEIDYIVKGYDGEFTIEHPDDRSFSNGTGYVCSHAIKDYDQIPAVKDMLLKWAMRVINTHVHQKANAIIELRKREAVFNDELASLEKQLLSTFDVKLDVDTYEKIKSLNLV